MAYHQPYGYTYTAPRKRGKKRLIFGILGLIANAIGLVVMPIVAGIIGTIVTVAGGADVTQLEPDGGSFQASSWSLYTVAVPESDLETATCEITGQDISVEPGDPTISTVEHGGVEYFDLYDITVYGDQEVTVACEGAEDVLVAELGMLGMLIGAGIGVVLPVALGILALVMTISGAVALMRS
ncbi:MAG: hypothetical protein ACTHWF_01575 [Brachybacterium sp.]|uniref:hypothetical protein n=1 Tax=Brachybacterium sp. Z12 TaxID=2759167 RepID=UPI00185F462E|nr:hypothetical protein [Brachybacterium sp. Z12]QNN83055.1 hypothetical protein H3H54_04765 [Brachybacterium sp. Z12]